MPDGLKKCYNSQELMFLCLKLILAEGLQVSAAFNRVGWVNEILKIADWTSVKKNKKKKYYLREVAYTKKSFVDSVFQ